MVHKRISVQLFYVGHERKWLSFLLKHFKDFIYVFLERGEGREKEWERNINVWEIHWSVASHTTPTGDLAHNRDMCPDWESNWLPFSSQAGTQSTEPHQPGQNEVIFYCLPIASLYPPSKLFVFVSLPFILEFSLMSGETWFSIQTYLRVREWIADWKLCHDGGICVQMGIFIMW